MKFEAYSNMTVWSLKTLIAKHMNQSPLNIQIKRNDSKMPKDEIKDNKHCKLLADLEFQSDEVLTVTRARIPDTVAVPLLDREGAMVPEFEIIVREWFHTYSEDLTKDEIYEILNDNSDLSLPDTMRVMTRENGVEFAKAITTLTYIDINDRQIDGLFAYGKFLNQAFLIEQELINFFIDKAASKDTVVEQNLKHQGIGTDLKPKIDYHNLNWVNDNRVINDRMMLPRARLS